MARRTKKAAEWVPTDAVHAWEGNPRINDQAVDQVARSIERFGWGAPIVARKENGEIIAGHTRHKAAVKLGRTEVPVRYVELSEYEARALALVDNRSGEIADWDTALLMDALNVLEDGDASWAGWNDDAMAQMRAELDALEGEPGVVEDDPPDVPDNPVTNDGDIWTLGDHVLLCGDSAKSWVKVITQNEAQMMFTDPPYGVDYSGSASTERERIANDKLSDQPALLKGMMAAALQVVKAGGAWYVCAPSGPQGLGFASALSAAEVWRQRLVWVKDAPNFGRSDYHYKHEDIYYGWTPGGRHRAVADRTKTSIWEFPKPRRSEQHPTMKPVALCAEGIRNSSNKGERVWEPFAGSGSTLIACEQLERKCSAVEISPAYCDVIVERWQTLTGRSATRKKDA